MANKPKANTKTKFDEILEGGQVDSWLENWPNLQIKKSLVVDQVLMAELFAPIPWYSTSAIRS